MKTLKIVVNLLLVGLLVWFLATHEQKIRPSVAGRDSIQYWATGTLLAHRQNPYSVPSVLALQRSQGYPAARPLMLRTPPWSAWMVLPLVRGWWRGRWGWWCCWVLQFSSCWRRTSPFWQERRC